VGVVSLLAKRIKYYRILTASPPYLIPMAIRSMLSFNAVVQWQPSESYHLSARVSMNRFFVFWQFTFHVTNKLASVASISHLIMRSSHMISQIFFRLGSVITSSTCWYLMTFYKVIIQAFFFTALIITHITRIHYKL